MLKALLAAEARLPVLMQNLDDWASLDVDYEPPRVERLWRFLEDGSRLYLHRIHPCEKALFHPHPWPSAIKVVSGAYEMGVGSSASADEPAEAMTLLLRADSAYEMIEPNGWHYVRPVDTSSLSLMITGAPWAAKHPGLKGPKGKPLEPLSRAAKAALFVAFRARYGALLPDDAARGHRRAPFERGMRERVDPTNELLAGHAERLGATGGLAHEHAHHDQNPLRTRQQRGNAVERLIDLGAELVVEPLVLHLFDAHGGIGITVLGTLRRAEFRLRARLRSGSLGRGARHRRGWSYASPCGVAGGMVAPPSLRATPKALWKRCLTASCRRRLRRPEEVQARFSGFCQLQGGVGSLRVLSSACDTKIRPGSTG